MKSLLKITVVAALAAVLLDFGMTSQAGSQAPATPEEEVEVVEIVDSVEMLDSADISDEQLRQILDTMDMSGLDPELAEMLGNYARSLKKEPFVPDTADGTARDAFVKLKVDGLDMLTKSMRLDMLDYYDARRPHLQKNTMEGMSRLDTVADDYLKVDVSDVSSFAIRILRDKKSTPVIMTLYTVGADGQAADTQIDFYDIYLNRLDTSKYWKTPDIRDFLNTSSLGKAQRKNINNAIPFPTFVFDASSNNLLTGHLTVESYMASEDYDMVKRFIRPQVVYVWDGSKFKLK